MPNHVTNRVVVTGPSAAIAAFCDAFFVEDVEVDDKGQKHRALRFDFNRIILRPKILEKTESSSAVSMGLLILGRPEIMTDGFAVLSLEDEVARYLDFPWVRDAGITDYDGLKALLAERCPDCITKARLAIRAHEECGHASWYSWSIANWGTKWNAYGLDILREHEDVFEFRFDTAWSPPEPVFAALADRPECNDLHITIRGFDEGWGFAYRAEIADGIYNDWSVEPSPSFHAEVYGPSCLSADDAGVEQDRVPGAAPT